MQEIQGRVLHRTLEILWRSRAGCALLLLLVANFAAQSQRAIDLRHQLVPIPEEQFAAAKIPISSVIDGGAQRPFPVSVSIESISPVSEVTGTMVIDVSIRNSEKRALRIPVSREMKVLRHEANLDQRQLICMVNLTSDAAKAESSFLGFMTFSSSTDTSSMAVLPPGDSLRLTFETSFQRPWETDAPQWKDRIRQGTVSAKLACHETTIEADLTAQAGRPRFNGFASEVVTSNSIPLSLKP